MIYFVENAVTHDIKVGRSDDPEKRLGELQTGSSSPLLLLGTIPGGLKEERAIHAVLDNAFDRTTGEWFEPSPELRRYVRMMINSQHGLLGFFVRSKVIEPQLCFIASAAVGFTVSIYWVCQALLQSEPETFFTGNRAHVYQVMRWDEKPGRGKTFWDWYLFEMPQYYPTPVEAVTMFVHAWQEWLAEGGDPN